MGGNLARVRTRSKHTVGITMEDYAMMKAIWSRIELEPKIHGTGFYMKYFATYPQYIKYFLTDSTKDDVNLDALLVVKFTVVIEILGYLILDFYNKPKEFHQLIGYVAMMHKDMDLSEEDTNNFFVTLVDYLKDTMGGLMTENCEQVFFAFFRHIQELMMKSMEEERQRFAEEMNEDFAPHSPFKTLVPCFDFRNKLIYGQPREYWEARQREWQMRMAAWEDNSEVQAPAAVVQILAESSSSEEDFPGRGNKTTSKDSDAESRKTYDDDENQPDSLFMQRARYMTTGILVSVPHFDQLAPEFSDISIANEIEESHLISGSEARSAGNVRLTPRERHRAAVVASKSLLPRTSGRIISSTDTGTPRHSESSARERRRSSWN